MRNIWTIIILALSLISCSGITNSQVEVFDPLVENLNNPLGLETKQPRFSWKIKSSERGVYQQAYRIMVASSIENLEKENFDLWDSGKTESDETLLIPYNGKSLESRQAYFWKVKIWTNSGHAELKTNNYWTMGLAASDWQAKWIGTDLRAEGEDRKDNFKPKTEDELRLKSETRLNARYLRKDFSIDKDIANAYLYISGLGLYEAYLNGEKIGDQVLAPTPTDYSKTVPYNTFDVTECVKKGDNAIGVVLGNGRFFSMRIPWFRTFGLPQLLAQLEVTYIDGSKTTIVSDESWKITIDGPIGSNNEFDGEEYDARKEMPDWNKVGFDSKDWHTASIMPAPNGKIVAQENPNIKIMDTVKPISINKIAANKYILDMGQNMVGWVTMRVKGERGKTVKLRFAELLKEDGNLYTDNLRGAKVTDLYTLKGGNTEVWQPSFVFHGFRYVEISDFPGEPKIENFEGKVIYDEMETTGSFETSNKIINQIHTNSYWGIRGNYRGMPTDCPQRDERMGWLGDRTAGAYGESYIFGNQKLYAKWMQDIEDSQRENGALPDVAPNYWEMYTNDITWPAAYFAVADMLYNKYGDDRPIRKHYDSFKRFMSFVEKNYLTNYIATNDTFGDWCMPPESLEMIHSQDPNRKTSGELLATAFYYKLAVQMQQFAKITGNTADIEYYTSLGENVKKAFNNKFFDPVTKSYSNNTVTANLLALMHGIADNDMRPDVFNHIAAKTEGEFSGHVSTGLIGIQYLMRGLTDYGRADLAYKIAGNTSYPSWGYMIENGATTIWELWNGNTADPSMNSANHVMLLGDLIVWYYEYLGGIKNAADGGTAFKNIEMKPLLIGDLTYVKSTYNSVRGQISSHWQKSASGFAWDISIPANTRAKIHIPDAKGKTITENGIDIHSIKHISDIQEEGNDVVFNLQSGTYSFKVN